MPRTPRPRAAARSPDGRVGRLRPRILGRGAQDAHFDACAPRQPQAKGKSEAKVRLSRLLVDTRRRYASREELQAETDARIERWAKRAICPATGQTVQESWELERLAPLPILPEPFDIAVTRPVGRDALVRFEGREYAVPFRYADQAVEVRGCASTVQILAEGRIVREYEIAQRVTRARGSVG